MNNLSLILKELNNNNINIGYKQYNNLVINFINSVINKDNNIIFDINNLINFINDYQIKNKKIIHYFYLNLLKQNIKKNNWKADQIINYLNN